MRYRQLYIDELSKIVTLVCMFCLETDAKEGSDEAIISRIRGGKTFVFIAETDSEIVGLLGYYVVDGNLAVPDFFYVVPSYRDTVVGGLLHRIALKHMKQHKMKKIFLLASPDKEELYSKIGFHKVVNYTLMEKEIYYGHRS